ncbi:MAG: (2Fe-2S)-binding protein [Bacteroidetes bacterium RIFCSPLOWO2_02_FULL_36_8]|nr:MAG: (2Fe-2S)-binding protein [Bacteroidetes bacterium RIFCSPLOWO2_02_FULL_36_8]OFY71559.1 MAG: (2Fe-2S)-binding protein [Bacteroidetes bacterium RIFCSPLOWO2_12_FULL_37_12]
MSISFKLNGQKVTREIKPSLLLIELIRDEFGLTGTKPGCLEGECGACSVLVNGEAINSCLFLALNIDKKELITIEGLAGKNELDEVQKSLIKKGAVQCGFCTSGMAISIKSIQNHFSKQKYKPAKEEIVKMLEGNLCRCTGYVKIIEAAVEVIRGIRV